MIRFNWNNVLFDMTDIGGGPLGENIPRHTHAKDSYELHFIVGGKGKLITDTNEYELSEGNFFITGPNIYHEQTADRNEPVQDVFIMLQAVNTDKANAVSLTFLENHFCFLKHFDIATAQEILAEFRNRKIDYESSVCGLTMKLLTNITRHFLPESLGDNISADGLYDKRFVIIEQAFLYTPNLTLTALSNKIGVCERQTQRLLKKILWQNLQRKEK